MSRAPEIDFGGARVALLESRLAVETAAMVRRLGGDPVSAPALAEEDIDADAAILAFIERVGVAPADPIVVFLTGGAVSRLFAAADRLGCAAPLLACLSRALTVARGPKPAGALGRRGLSPSRAVPEPFTTTDVIAVLETMAVADRDVTVVHYGERSEPLIEHLAARRAHVHELMLYEWRLPDDTAALSRTIDGLIAGDISVLAFTSQVQVRHLLEVAGASRRDRLIAALNDHVLVGAVGPTCGAACASAGIRSAIVPDHPKLGPLLHALAGAQSDRVRPAIQRGSHLRKESA